LDNINLKYEELVAHSAQNHDNDGPSDTNYHAKNQYDLNKEEPKNARIQRIGSRVLYINNDHE
jgi:hypothetical protein